MSAVLTDEADVASEDTEDGQGLSSGVRSSSLLLRMGSRRVSLKIGGLGSSENGEHGADRRESVLEEEDGQVREERWQKELEVFQDLSEQLKLREAEDYNFSGGFGLPSEKYVEQHRFLRVSAVPGTLKRQGGLLHGWALVACRTSVSDPHRRGQKQRLLRHLRRGRASTEAMRNHSVL